MITNKNFTKEWIEDKSNSIKKGKKKADPELIEKVINALYLLENLVKVDLNFIFKGGTSLILLLNQMYRFSIDIDIIIEENVNKNILEEAFNKIIENNNIFYKVEEIKRNSEKEIPKGHYKFFYKSVLDQREKYILLDILFEKNPYTNIVQKEITNNILETEGEIIKVSIPSAECILGDKMTAFAPNTTGIRYEVDKQLEIIKQLFDVSNLFDEIENMEIVRNTFITVSKQELEYRKLNSITFEEVLDDIIETAIIIAFRGAIEKEKFKELEEGVKRIKGYIFTKNYIIEDAILSAGKAAYLASLVKKSLSEVERYDPKEDITKLVINNERFAKSFNTIKKFSPEGFYYWYKAIELMDMQQ